MQPSLLDLIAGDPLPPDQGARDFATNPTNDVVLEASAGTGKTRVLVDRYVRLIKEGVDPRHVLAVTFTRKAAAEMRDRILAVLRQKAATDQQFEVRWQELRERIADVQISTIDAFCFSLLREFPLEARVDPAFEIADETEMARFGKEALDLTLRVSQRLIADDHNVRLLFARVKLGPLRDAIQGLLDRRHVAVPAVAAFVSRRARCASATGAAAAFLERLRAVFGASPYTSAILTDGPEGSPEFRWLREDIAGLAAFPATDLGWVQQLQRRLQRYFLTDQGTPRRKTARRFNADLFASADARQRHEAAVKATAPLVAAELEALRADVQGLLARGLQRVLEIAVQTYERLLEQHAVLDFAGMLAKSVALLSQQEEFARSRLKLQARYHHVLVDEFQDTSRLQWQLVALLIDAWGEGEGAQDAPTSIFVVGDRKQSIYRFRHAEVTLLDEVARKIAAIRPGRPVRQAITHSFRAVPELLAFVNALSLELRSGENIPERFTYDETDRFPVPEVAPGARRDGVPVLGLVAEASMEECARAVAAEVARLLASATVRTREGTRPVHPDDIGILFRARTGHQYFETALEARGIRPYVYKGLGFFDAPEVQDLQALLRYLAQPESQLRAAELLRSRFVRVSDAALARLAPRLSEALRANAGDPLPDLDDTDRALLQRVRADLKRWRSLTDRVSPSELLDTVLADSAYLFELGGRRLSQARENVKKIRGIVRRIENRGYATVGRIAEYFETLRAGDESHAVIEAAGCVNLMTIHAAKGLEFPIVFVVNLHTPGRGRSSAFSVIERGPDNEPEVAFGSSPATRLEDIREREELRRLLYVAATRARDRLYLAAEVHDPDRRLRRGPRSLASLLSAGLANLFATAASSDTEEVEWTTGGGAFAFRVCRPTDEPSEQTEAPRGMLPEPDMTPLVAVDPPIVAASVAGIDDVAPRPLEAAGPETDRLIGTVVHRLFQRRLDPELAESAVAELVPQVVQPEELVEAADVKRLIEAAASMYVRFRQRQEIVDLLAEGTCHYEVPFSYWPPTAGGGIVRGRIDCMVIRPDGSLTVLEFKTGHRRPEHERQVALYREALQAMLPGREVRMQVLYP